MYNFKDIEEKWQKKWYEEKCFKAVDFHPTKPKYYVLYEFFNISGNLHMGHLKGTVPADALARYKRFSGYVGNVKIGYRQAFSYQIFNAHFPYLCFGFFLLISSLVLRSIYGFFL